MQTPRRRFLCTSGAYAALPFAARADAAWPAKPLRIVTGGVGSTPDVRARWLADRLGSAIGQRVLVENRPGAGGAIGLAEVARSAPDGYTLGVIHQGTMAINPHLHSKLGYDPLSDFTPLTRLGVGGLLLTAAPELPVRSLGELVALAKAKPNSLKYGTPGIGTAPHLATELFLRTAGIEATHVSYKSAADVLRDLIGGHLSFSFDGMTVQMPAVKAGRVRVLGVTSARRIAALPDVPTLAEAGLPGYEYIGWIGLALPAATPAPIAARLHAEIVGVLDTAEAHEWFAQSGTEPGTMQADAFARFIREEHAKWGRVIREAGIKPE